MSNNYNHTEEFNLLDVSKNKLKAAVCYFGAFLIIPLLFWRKSDYVKFHLYQGFALFAVGIAIDVIDVLMGILLGSGLLYGIWGVVRTLLLILRITFMVLGICNAINGQAKELPLIGKIRFTK
ncbi:MAG: hypothetical protein Q4C42_00260 [Clostridia bacterium]|nr:hypothetical protein [Clostridia bacterium]